MYEDLDFVKIKTKETALFSFRQYNKNPQQNLSKEELVALTSLSKSKDIVIQKSDNSNLVVLIDKDAYIKRMENLLCDQRKLEKLTLTKMMLCSSSRKAYRHYFKELFSYHFESFN